MFVHFIKQYWGRSKTENELQIKELVRFCTATHFNKLKYPISKTKLLKFLYKATNDLSDSNPLKKCIPFYWYIHGPYSPPLLELNEQLLREQILQENKNGYIASNSRLCEHDEHFQEVRTAITAIISASISANSTTIEKLYEDEAPYKFYISFKSKFVATLHSYLYDEHSRFKSETLEDILHQTIGELPNETLYSRFKYAYLDFVNIITKLTKIELSNDSKKDIKRIAETIFETFAKGVRILHHDSYFDSNVSDWKIEFEDSINEMEQNIDYLHELYEKLASKKSNLLTFQSLVQQILNLKSKNELVMVSFLPPKNDVELNYGRINAELFGEMDNDEFQSLLNKFENSHNAIIYHATQKDMASITCRLQAS